MNKYPYPLTIVLDRYTGVYSGGKFTAWWRDADQVPSEISADDVTCANYWFSEERNEECIGKGDTIEDAVADLVQQIGPSCHLN